MSSTRIKTHEVQTSTLKERVAGSGVSIPSKISTDLTLDTTAILKANNLQKNDGSYISLGSSMVQSSGFIASPNITCDNLNENTEDAGVSCTADFTLGTNKTLTLNHIAQENGLLQGITLDGGIVQDNEWDISVGNKLFTNNLQEKTEDNGVVCSSNVIINNDKQLQVNTIDVYDGENIVMLSPIKISALKELVDDDGISIDCDVELTANMDLITDRVKCDLIHERSADSGILFENTLKLSVCDEIDSDKIVVWKSSNNEVGYCKPTMVKGYGNIFFDDFTSCSVGAWSGTHSHVACDRPWMVKSDDIAVVYVAIDTNDPTLQQAGEYMNGCIMPYISGSNNGDHCWAFNNYGSMFRENGDITFECRFRVPYAWSSGYYDTLRFFVGLGERGFDGDDIGDMTRWCGLYYDSAASNQFWSFNTNDVGVLNHTSAQYLNTAITKCRVVVKASTVEYWFDNGTFGAWSLNHTENTAFPVGQPFQPRFGMHVNPSLSAGSVKLGILVDYVRITQDFNRFG